MLTSKEFKEKICSLPKKSFDKLKFFDGEGNPLKTRNYMTVFYPESCDENWKINCEESGISCCISPIHDKDYYEKGDKKGELKKAHYHAIISYDGPKSAYQAYLTFCELFGETGFSVFERVDSISSSVQYLCHLNNPDKALYEVKDILAFNNFDVFKFITSDDVMIENLKELRFIIKENKIYFYDDLLELLENTNRDDLFTLLVKKKNVRDNVYEIIRSRNYKRKYLLAADPHELVGR